MKLSKLFITGCDSSTSWMVPWFKSNFERHNPTAKLLVYNFDEVEPNLKGWFKKPAVMIKASSLADQVCWLDTDCEVRGSLDGIFNYVKPKKLTMAIDQPWTKRKPEMGNWHNSGVVLFEGIPPILSEWSRYIRDGLTQERGDQEVLHYMLGGDPLRELTHINVMPKLYNTLRLDIIDKTVPVNPKIMHWTGAKGKDKIKEMING